MYVLCEVGDICKVALGCWYRDDAMTFNFPAGDGGCIPCSLDHYDDLWSGICFGCGIEFEFGQFLASSSVADGREEP